MTRGFSRRRFMVSTAAGALGLAATTRLAGCGLYLGPPLETGEGAQKEAAGPELGPLIEGSETAFPYVEVAGTPREIGRGIGKMFGDHVRTGLERRAEWFGSLKTFAMGDGRAAYDTFLAAAQKHTPRAYEELVGWSEGSGVPLEDLAVLNLKAELGAMIDSRERASTAPAEGNPGCSTIVQVAGGRVIHAHNEDGHDAYRDLMFLIKAVPKDGPAYLCLSYPGILPGNAPAMNAHGLVQTTNFIPCRDVKPGVGRYFLDRMILEAKSIEEALEWSTHPERAFGFHHVFTDLNRGRSVAVEVSPSKHEIVEIEGLYYHTNHLVMDGMLDEDQDEEYVSSSSTSRWDVLRAWANGLGDESGDLSADQIVAPLSSHQSAPYSPCRHPEGDVRGMTLGTAVFQSPEGTMRLSKGQPCEGKWSEYERPS